VFILGAGASKLAGAPLMNDFLDRAEYLWRAGQIREGGGSFERVFQAISELQQVHSKSQLDIQNVESVFAAFEMAKTINKFADYSRQRIAELVSAMKEVIVKTIERTVRLPVRGGGQPLAPIPYPTFAQLVEYLSRDANPPSETSIITFNYDMAIDYCFYINRIPLDYSLGEDRAAGAVPVLKLHGSLNWAHCSACDEVAPWLLCDFFKEHSWTIIGGENQNVALDIGSRLGKFMHCDKNVDKDPVLVPPTWNKTEYHRTLSKVWSRAAEELSNAENIFVIGYSLPESDAFFRYLYALGTVGKTTLKRFWVFNPEDSGATENRFRELLGPGAQARFRYFISTFDRSIQTIRKEFPGRK
jgi:hypothetical protein